MPWNSYCPVRRKKNLISCLVQRALKICSACNLSNELKRIKKIFENLGYPDDVVHKIVNSLVNAKNNKPNDAPEDIKTAV